MLIRLHLAAACLFCDTATDPAAGGAGNGGAGTATQTQSVPTAKPVQQQVPTTDDYAAKLMQSLGPQLQTLVTNAIAPVQAQATKLAADLEAAKAPQRQAASLFGGGAGHGGVSVGERAGSSRGFQFQRVQGYLQGMPEFAGENVKTEREFCHDLRALYQRAGLDMAGIEYNGREPLLCPLDSKAIPEEFKDQLRQKYGDIGEFIGAGMTGVDPDELRHMGRKHQKYAGRINQALSMFDDSGMGIFLEPGPHGEMIEFIRPNEALTKAGVRDIALPPNGYLPFGKQTGTGVAYWVGEAESVTKSQPVTGRGEMRAKKAGCLVQIPNELFKYASGTTEAFVRADIGKLIALLEDKAGLEGTGTSTQPLGVLNYPGVINQTGTVILGTNGNEYDVATPAAQIAAVEDLNYDVDTDGWAFIMRAPMWYQLANRRATMFSGGGETGQYLFPVQSADISKGQKYDTLRGWPVIKSGQVSNTRVKGSSSNLSYVVGGIWQNLLRGRVGVIEFAMATQGDSLFPNYLSQLRAIDFVDYFARYQNCFNVVDQIDMTLPNGQY